MDFTYFIAAFIALIIGFLSSLLFVLMEGRSIRRLIVRALVASLAINAMLLINWAYIGQVTASFLLADFAFITAYSLVGCLIGISPALALRGILRWHAKRSQ